MRAASLLAVVAALDSVVFCFSSVSLEGGGGGGTSKSSSSKTTKFSLSKSNSSSVVTNGLISGASSIVPSSLMFASMSPARSNDSLDSSTDINASSKMESTDFPSEAV